MNGNLVDQAFWSILGLVALFGLFNVRTIAEKTLAMQERFLSRIGLRLKLTSRPMILLAQISQAGAAIVIVIIAIAGIYLRWPTSLGAMFQ
jgi:hypothetical protein